MTTFKKRRTGKRIKIRGKKITTLVKKTVPRNPTFNKTNEYVGLGFPKRMTMTQKYVETVTLTGTTGLMGTTYFSVNSMNDPNVTGIGHQPLYYDQAMAVYNRYCVIGSKITVNFIPNTAVQGAIACGLLINDDTALANSIVSAVVEQSQGRAKYIAFGNSDPCILTAKWSAKKAFGGSVLSNNELGGALGSSPAKQEYFTIWAQALDGSSTVVVLAQIQVDYICVYKEIKDIVQS